MGIMYKLMKHRNLTMDLSKPNLNTNTMKSDRNRLITIEGNIIDTADTTAIPATEEVLSNNKNMDATMDKQFTAEHIIQLCKFLAEKSKRNKNLYKQQQSPKKLTKSKQSEFQFQQMEYDVNDEVEDFYQNEALPLLSKQRLEQQQRNHTDEDNDDDDDDENSEDDEFEQHKTSAVLSTRLSPDINSLNISSNTTTSATSCALQHHQQQQIFNYQHHQHHLHEQQQQQQQQPHHQQQISQNQGKRDILLKIRRQIFERKRLRENGAFEPQALNNSQVWRPW